MAVDLDLLNANSITNINTNFVRVQAAFQDALSRSGNLPNHMNADLDMNSNDILNIKLLQADDIVINGLDMTGLLEAAEAAVIEAQAAADDAEASAIAAADSAASINLPSLTIGDVGKQLFVNILGNGYDLGQFQAGTNITIDDTDPANPIINAAASSSLVAGQGTSIDNTNPALPVISVALSPPQGRLTTTSGVAVMTSNALAATTLYYTPSNGNMVPIYDGTKFVPRLFVQMSQLTTDTTKSPAACAADTNYDLFVWDDAGTLRCTRGPAWTNSGAGTSARGTGAGTTELDFTTPFATNKNAITNGPAANRGTYVGSIRTNASSQIDMSFGGSASGGVAGFNGIWNMYNRVLGAFVCIDNGASYTYNVDAIRRARNSANNQHTFFFGLPQDAYSCNYSMRVDTPATVNAFGQIGMGLNSITNFVQRVFIRTVAANIQIGSPFCSLTRIPQLGHVVIAGLESSDAAGDTITFNADANAALQGEVWW